MYKVSVIGIDNTGKTSVVESLGKIADVNTVHLTAHRDHGSGIAKVSGRTVNKITEFGEIHNLKYLTGFGYLLHLFPYYFEERAKSSSQLLVSDRDPIVDSLCYCDLYIPDNFSKIVKPSLKSMLERSFNYPSAFCYLEASPEVSARRNDKPAQLHDKVELLSRLRELFDQEMFRVGNDGIRVVKIDTDAKSLEQVKDEVRYCIKKLL